MTIDPSHSPSSEDKGGLSPLPLEKIDFLGTKLAEEIERVNELTKLIRAIWDDLCEVMGRNWELNYNRNQLDNRFNELTHLHNEIHDIQSLLGMDGSPPKYTPPLKYK